MIPDISYPKLRPVEPVAVNHGGWPALALRDPLGLSQNIVVVPQPVAPLLALCDGTRDVAGLRAGFAVRTGILLAEDEVARLIDRLDDALLLENDRFAAASQAQLETYRSAPFRPPALAGASYPAEPEALRHYLQRFLTDMPPTNAPAPGGRGLVSPHIDYSRGGQVYAQVWSQATSMVTHADLAVILGTDHHGGLGSITLTRQNYATPFGVLPTAQDEVGAVAEALGSEAAFAEELHHRREHSVELAAIWLHFMRNGEAIELVPILCGSFAHFVMGLADPRADDNIDTAVKALRQATAGRQVVVIAAGDLAHVGPAFGDRQPLDWSGRARVQSADGRLVAAMCRGNADDFFQAIQVDGDRYRVCGLPPIYLALRLLGQVHGTEAGYDRCPADATNGSIVSICGIVWD